MKRRPPAPRRSSPRRPAARASARPLEGWGALVRVDGRRLREKTEKACRRAAERFEADDRALRLFEEREVPAYEHWRRIRLGPLLSDLDRLRNELSEVAMQYDIAQRESFLTGLPPWAALRAWRERMEREAAKLKAEEERRGRAGNDPGRRADEDEDVDEGDDPLAAFFRAMGLDPEELDDADDEGPRWEDYEPPRPATAPARSEPARGVREVYRALCRLLHPDAAGEMSERRLAIWHQVQDAYAARDLPRLDALLARVEQDEGLATRPRTIGELLDLKRHYERARSGLRRVLREALRHPAWGFSDLDPGMLERRERLERAGLERAIRDLSERVRRLRAMLEPPKARRKRSPRAPGQLDLPLEELFR